MERFTVEEMQNWNKRYKLDKETAKCVIDTFDGGEYWTVHGNEAYNLCIDMNALYDENEQLKSDIEYIKQLIKDRIKHYHSYSCIRFSPNEHKGCIGLKMELEKIYDDIDW